MEKLPLIASLASIVSAVVLILVLLKLICMSRAAKSQLPGTALTAPELGKELGRSIDSAFQQYVPQPEKLSAVLSGAIEQAGKKAQESADSSHKVILAGQEKTAEKMAAHEKTVAANLEAARKALEEAAAKLGSALTTASDKLTTASAGLAPQLEKTGADIAAKIKSSVEPAVASLQTALTAHATQMEKIETGARDQLKAVLGQHSEGLQKALTANVQHLEKSGSSAGEQLKTLLTQHADAVQKASSALAGQLDKIMALEKDIQQVLHVQQVTEGTIKSVATSDEFKQTLSSLRQHLAASDSLIKEVTKPRTIKLIESES
jgi:hypothetical protein